MLMNCLYKDSLVSDELNGRKTDGGNYNTKLLCEWLDQNLISPFAQYLFLLRILHHLIHFVKIKALCILVCEILESKPFLILRLSPTIFSVLHIILMYKMNFPRGFFMHKELEERIFYFKSPVQISRMPNLCKCLFYDILKFILIILYYFFLLF